MSTKEIVTNNLDPLSHSTVVSVELATLALQKGLVTQEEFEILTAPVGPNGCTNYQKATLLYTRGIQKWTNSEFKELLSVLESTGNARAFEIINSSSCSSVIGEPINGDTIEKILGDKKSLIVGSFEGYMLQDELEAKQIQVIHNESKLKRFFNLSLFKSRNASTKRRKERLHQLLNIGKVWWNPTKPQLPPDYIERKVFQLTQTGDCNETTLLDLVLPSAKSDDWNKWEGDDQVLVLLVDSPGMGKSCLLTRLEQELRGKLDKSPRIIVRINLNRVGSGVGESTVENEVQKVTKELFEPLKNVSTGEKESPVYVLLDGLDEVLPQNQESLLTVIRFLLSDRGIQEGWVIEKVVLTSRPHLKEMIESEFKVRAYSLVPLTQEEQVEFILKRSGRRDAQELLSTLSESVSELISNPLMLSMYYSVMIHGKKSNSFDQYDMYLKFMVKKHEFYVLEKIGRSFVSRRVLKQMLTSYVPFYNCVAIEEILGEDKLSKIIYLSEKAGKEEIIQKVSSPERQSGLINVGVVVKNGNQLKFAHRSFAEFFYVKLMTDIGNTPEDVRNALFAFGYVVRSNLAEFVSCVVGKDTDAVQFVSKGWTKFVPEGSVLWRYVENDGILLDHIMSNAIEYEEKGSRRDELLVRDIRESFAFVEWLSMKIDEALVRNFLINENNTRVLAALVFSSRYEGNKNWQNVFESMRLCKDLLCQRITLMPFKEREVIALDFLAGTCGTYYDFDPRGFTLLASVFSREKLHHLIVNEETRVTDLVGGLQDVSTCLGEEFLPNKLLKFRFKFGENKSDNLFQQWRPTYWIGRVWEEIEENIQDAVQVVLDDKGFQFIRQMDNNLRTFEGSSELRESRRRLLVDILAKVDWSDINLELGSLYGNNLINLIAYGKLDQDWKWNILTTNRNMTVRVTNGVSLFLGCLMLSALNEKRVPVEEHSESLASPATFNSVRKVVRLWGENDKKYRNLLSFISDLSREELLNLATMKAKDPVVLSDFPSVWELFFHPDKGLAKVNREKAMAVLNEEYVLEKILKDLLESDDPTILPEEELKRVLIKERGLVQEERVNKAMIDDGLLHAVAWRACDLWLDDGKVRKNFLMGVVQVYVDIFKGQVDDWADRLAKDSIFPIPVQLLVIATEKLKSGGGSEWSNLFKRVEVITSDHFRKKLSLNDLWTYRWIYARSNRECDWYELLMVLLQESPEIKTKIPADYANRTKVYSNWQCGLLRVWIQLFGEEETRRQTDETFQDENFWERESAEMNDGELLHIAVELGSLIGVKWTAWPRMLNWMDGNNRTALELAKEKLGKDHEVTEYLGRVADNLTESGFFGS